MWSFSGPLSVEYTTLVLSMAYVFAYLGQIQAAVPFKFRETLHNTIIDLSGEMIKDHRAVCASLWRGSRHLEHRQLKAACRCAEDESKHAM